MYDAQDRAHEKVMQGQRPDEHHAGDMTPPSEKGAVHLEEDVGALAHHAVTDEYGRPIVHLDPQAEKKLLWKLDLYVVPTVAVLYLFCFIDVRPCLADEARTNDLAKSSAQISVSSYSPPPLTGAHHESLPGNANIAGLQKDLGMAGYDYNLILTAFYIP